MVGQIGTIVMGIADTLMIGHYGTKELAAAGFANNVIGLLIISAMGFSYGLTPIVSFLYGEGRTCEIGGKLKNSLLTNNIISICMMLAMTLVYLNLQHLGLPQDLLPIIKPYLAILTISIFPQMAFNAFKQFSDGIQDTRTPMWVLLFGNALNILLNWLLIFGAGPIPPMGLIGAGLATLASRTAMWAAMAIIFHLTSFYGIHSHSFSTSTTNMKDCKHLMRLGLPLMLQMGMETASFSLSAIYVGWLGTTALAAHQIMITIGQLCFMLYYGMAAAVAVEVSYHRGTGNIAKTQTTAMAGLQLTWLLGAMLTLPILMARNSIGMLFTDNAEVVTLVSAVIIPFAFYQFGDALQCIYSNALRGMEDVKPLIWIAFIAYFVISLPLGYAFGFVVDGGLTGIWTAFPFGLTSAGVMYYWRFQKGRTVHTAVRE